MERTVKQQGLIQRSREEPATPTPASLMKSVLDSRAMREILHNSLRENAGAFAASLIELYSTDTLLQSCQPQQVVQEALKAVSLKLPINKQLGFAYIIPYKGKPQFQLGYKGYIQLCLRTGAYRYINAGPVYEGELARQDKLTGMADLSGERISGTIVGYFAYLETVNGFCKCDYWPQERVRAHAQRYSPNYGAKNGVWQKNFDEMAAKTVLRNLLAKYGVMSVELEQAFASETAELAAAPMRDSQAAPTDTVDVEPVTPEEAPLVDEEGVILTAALTAPDGEDGEAPF